MASLFRRRSKVLIPNTDAAQYFNAQARSGKLVPMVRFVGADGKPVEGRLSDDGKYGLIPGDTWSAAVKVRNDFKQLPGFRDKKATEELARKVEKLALLRAINETPDAELIKFAEELPKKQRAKLLEWGLLDDRAANESVALREHLEAYQRDMENNECSAVHVQKTIARIRRVLDGIGAKTLRTLTAERVKQYLADRRKLKREDKGLSPRSSNAYLWAVKGFCAWLVTSRRARENPLAILENVQAEVDRRHVRRALEVHEIAKLLRAAKDGSERFGMTGESRFWLYKLAIETGLRSSELRSLIRASFNLADTATATVTVEAAYTKNRKKATLPLRPDTVEGLRTFLANKLPTARVFNLPRPENIVVMLRGDLDAALIPYRDEAERVFDFHALRKCFASLLLAYGTDLRTAKELMRHSSIKLTGDLYAVSLVGSHVEAVARLPKIDAAPKDAKAATGTDGRTCDDFDGSENAQRTAQNSAPKRSSKFAHVRENREAEPLKNFGKTSAKGDLGQENTANRASGENGKKVPPREVESLSTVTMHRRKR